jgi:hypothetical protein
MPLRRPASTREAVTVAAVISIVRLRRRMPLVVFILLLVLLVVALGLICLCASDHPAKAAERAASAAAHVPAVIPVWSLLVLLAAPVFPMLPVVSAQARGRASPASLQRFLF